MRRSKTESPTAIIHTFERECEVRSCGRGHEPLGMALIVKTEHLFSTMVANHEIDILRIIDYVTQQCEGM